MHPFRLSYTGCMSVMFFLVTSTSCVNDEQKVKEMFEKKTGLDEAEGVVSYMSQGGRTRAKLTAPTLLRFQDTLPRMEFPRSLHVDFFDSTMHVENQVDALFGRYLETQNKVYMRDSVRVFNIKADTLFCQELWWDQNNQQFHTDKPVRIHRPGMIINGVGLRAPQDFKTFDIFQITNSVLRVQNEITVPDSTSLTDTSRLTR
jgi:LPS export ABC transporter protein LptC